MVFERADRFPTPEDHLPDCPVPLSAYGFSKLTGEVYCRAAHEEHGLPYTICRPFNAYGPGEVPDAEPGIAHAVPDLIRKVLSGQRPLQIFGSGEQTRTLTHVDDIADGVVAAMGSPAGLSEDFNISASRELTVAEIARIVWEACGEDPAAFALERLPSFTGRRPAALALGREGAPAARLGGQIDVEDGIAATVAGCASARRCTRGRHGTALADLIHPRALGGLTDLAPIRRVAVPLFDTSSPLAPLRDRAARGGRARARLRPLHPRPRGLAFEQELAAYCGTPHAVGVANGTEALTIALRAMGVGPGDEVVVPSFTFYASAEAIPPTGAAPVFCDIDPSTYCITADTVQAALTPRTKAVIAVHLFGNLAPVAEIEALGRARPRGRRPVRRLAWAGGGAPRLARQRRPRSPSSPPRTSGASATAARSPPPTPSSPNGRAHCASTAPTTRSPTSWSATTPVSTSCRRRFCAYSCPTWTLGPTGRRAARRPL